MKTVLDRYREESSGVMIPADIGGQPRSVVFVVCHLFLDPRRALDRAFFESLPPYGMNVERKMTYRTFRRVVGRLGSMGLVEGDRVPDHVVRSWEAAWRADRRRALGSSAEGGAT
jgi:hypothetical protein